MCTVQLEKHRAGSFSLTFTWVLTPHPSFCIWADTHKHRLKKPLCVAQAKNPGSEKKTLKFCSLPRPCPGLSSGNVLCHMQILFPVLSTKVPHHVPALPSTGPHTCVSVCASVCAGGDLTIRLTSRQLSSDWAKPGNVYFFPLSPFIGNYSKDFICISLNIHVSTWNKCCGLERSLNLHKYYVP